MSDYYRDDDDRHDPYRAKGSGTGVPVLSWKRADVGDKVKGIVVPPDPFSPTLGYDTRRSWSNDEDDKGPLVWPGRSGYALSDGTLHKRPITEATFERWAKANGFTGKVDRKFHGEITLVTDFRTNELVSGPQRERRKEEGIEDDGLRRVIDDHFDLTPKIKEELERIGARCPEPGQTWEIGLSKREPNKAKGESNIFAVTITPPTPETMKVVEKYVAEQVAAKKAAETTANSPYATAPAGQPEEPPF